MDLLAGWHVDGSPFLPLPAVLPSFLDSGQGEIGRHTVLDPETDARVSASRKATGILLLSTVEGLEQLVNLLHKAV